MRSRPYSVTLLRQRLIALLNAMPAATAGDTESVHRARVASRRLRAALPVLAEAVQSASLGRVRKLVRRITRALGPVRELDVALVTLAELGPRAGVSPRALASVQRALESERQTRRRDMLDVIRPTTLEKLKTRIATAPGPAPAAQPAAEIGVATRRAGLRAAALRAAIDRAGGLYLPDRLHAVRVAAKKLRYALEVERELRRSRATARINNLKALQDRLGRMHDLDILIDRIRGVQAELAAADRATALELDTLVRALEQECRAEHAAYMQVRADMLALCDRIRDAAHAGRSTIAA